MLSTSTAVSGHALRMWRVATAPFMLERAKSITTTAGPQAAGFLHGFIAIAGLAHYADTAILLQQPPKAPAHQAMIVHQQNCNFGIRHEGSIL